MADPTDSTPSTGPIEWLKKQLGVSGKEPATIGSGGKTVDEVVDEASSGKSADDSKLGRMKQAQSTDRDNSYSY